MRSLGWIVCAALVLPVCGDDGGHESEAGTSDADTSGSESGTENSTGSSSGDGDGDSGDGDSGDGSSGVGDGESTGDGDGESTGDGDGLPPDWHAPPYLMWGAPDAMSLLWEDKLDTIGRVEYGTSADALNESMEDSTATQVHEFRIEGLSPDTQYFYRVLSDGDHASEVYSFWTAPTPGTSADFSFLVWGDNQNGPDNFSENVANMVEDGARFMVSTGDCVQNGTREEYRSQLFAPLAPLARSVPFLVGMGNHELYSDAGADLFNEYMAQPGDEHCFGWRWGNTYIQFIDSEESISVGSDQYACIVAGLSSLEATSATFRAAAFHKPPRIEYWFGGIIAFIEEMEAPWIREELEPTLESLDVHIVFNGHNHLYAHTPTTSGGITWVTTGGAGGMLDTDSALWKVGDWPEIATQVHEFHYTRVDVVDDSMTVNAIGLDGSTLHSFSISN